MALKREEVSQAYNEKINNIGLKEKPIEPETQDQKLGRGRPPKGEKWKSIQIRMSPSDIKALSDYCRDSGTTLSNKVRELIIQFMNQKNIR